MLAPGFDHFPAFPDIVGRGFFDVDVLARLAGPDGRERVPVIGGDDGDGVNLLVVKNHAEVPAGRRLHVSAYDLALNPIPPIVSPAVPITLDLINSLRLWLFVLITRSLSSKNRKEGHR
jgi:hypothetical protein